MRKQAAMSHSITLFLAPLGAIFVVLVLALPWLIRGRSYYRMRIATRRQTVVIMAAVVAGWLIVEVISGITLGHTNWKDALVITPIIAAWQILYPRYFNWAVTYCHKKEPCVDTNDRF